MATANEATAQAARESRELLKELGLVLDDFEKRAEHNNADWGHAGVISNIRDSLLERVARFHPEYAESEERARVAIAERVERAIS